MQTPPQPVVAAAGTPEALLQVSHQFFQAGQYEESIAAAKKALELRPEWAEAYNNIAAANNALHRWNEGIWAAMQAVRIKPDYQLARNNLAWGMTQKTRSQVK
jgi:Flp pilus assembly protein TadD